MKKYRHLRGTLFDIERELRSRNSGADEAISGAMGRNKDSPPQRMLTKDVGKSSFENQPAASTADATAISKQLSKHPSEWGITLKQIKELKDKADTELKAKYPPGIDTCTDLNMYDLDTYVVRPLTSKKPTGPTGCGYALSINPEGKKAKDCYDYY